MKRATALMAVIILFFSLPGLGLAPAEPGGRLEPLAEGLPGRLVATGTRFALGGRSLESTRPIGLVLESVAGALSLQVRAAAGDAGTRITLRGLEPHTAYHKYQDDYHQHALLTTDASGALSYWQDLARPHVVFIQCHRSTIFLSDAGWSDPALGTWDAATKTATLLVDVTDTIQIDSDGITLEGNGHVASGTGSGNGVYMNGRTGVTVRNLTVRGFAYGIYLYSSTNNTLSANTVTGNGYGFYLAYYSTGNAVTGNTASGNATTGFHLSYSGSNTLSGNTASSNGYYGFYLENSSFNVLSGNTANSNADTGIYLRGGTWATLSQNTATSNAEYGIRLDGAGGNTLTGNVMAGNRYNFHLEGTSDFHHANTIGTTNLVEGRPVYYLRNTTGQTIDGGSNAGVVYLVGCSGTTVRGLDLTRNGAGVYLWKTTGSRIENVQANYNRVGIWLRNASDGNDLSGNTANWNTYQGIQLESSGNNTLHRNDARSNGSYGAYLRAANGNRLTGNTFSNNPHGLRLEDSSDNQVYNNNFISNGTQASAQGGSGNSFNQPPPVGGNHWSNWTTPDGNGDGFVDNPFTFPGGSDALPWSGASGWADSIPPTTTVSLAGTLGKNGWYRSDVVVTLSAIDNPGGSGVKTTEYSLDGTSWATYGAPFSITAEGATTFYYRSTDNAGNVERPAEEVAVFSDDFATLDGAQWVDAGFLPLFVGRPQTLSPATVDGRSALRMQTVETPPDKRRGIATAGALTVGPEMAVEVAFKPLGSIDGLMELWLFNPANGRYLRASACSPSYGNDKTLSVELSGYGERISPNPIFGWGEWLILRLDLAPAQTTVSLLDANRAARWSTTYDIGLATLMGEFRLALSQHLGSPYQASWTMAADVDYVRVVGLNRVSKSETVKIDKTPPTISGGPTTPANAHGWYKASVTVHFAAADALSGLDAVTPDVTLTTEGAGQTVTGTATDVAGNTAALTVGPINIDKTPPTLQGLPTTSPNAAGWYRSDVTIHWAAADALSGIDPATAPPDSLITGEGASLGAGPVTVSDRAGNQATASVSGIKIDRTPPTLTIRTPQPGASLAQGTALDFSATDSLSGVASVVATLQSGTTTLTVSSGYRPAVGTYTLVVQATDHAGNTASETRSFVIYQSSNGFVVGAGWVDSPAGAYTADPRLTDRAIFSMFTIYPQGAAVPFGRTLFLLPNARLSFVSSGHEWLVVSGPRAQYQGWGTINGTGNYGFQVTVIDGQASGGGGKDRFRIKIWDRTAGDRLVYDTQPGADDADPPTTGLVAGSIVIYTGRFFREGSRELPDLDALGPELEGLKIDKDWNVTW